MRDGMHQEPPHSVETEQTVLGNLLINNDVFDHCQGLEPRHFFDPLHGRIFKVCGDLINRGKTASPVTLHTLMKDDPGFEGLGGTKYLVRLAGASLSVFATKDYAEILKSLAAKRDVIAASERAIERAHAGLEGGDVEEILADLEAQLFEARVASGLKAPARSFLNVLMSATDRVNEAYQNDGTGGLQTGIKDLDSKLGGLQPGRSYIIAGRPSMGKSSAAMNIATRVASKVGVIVASLEMSEEELAIRSVSQLMYDAGHRVPYSDATKGSLSEEQMRRWLECVQDYQALNLWLIGPEHTELASLVSAIKSTAKRFRDDCPLGLVVIDYLQLIQMRGATDFARIGAASKAVKMLARQLNVPVICLSQLNRSVESREDKRPALSDLRQSGEIEEDADSVIFCYRDEYYLERNRPPEHDAEATAVWQASLDSARNSLELIVAKQRGGPIGTVRLHCEIQYQHISDRARDLYNNPYE